MTVKTQGKVQKREDRPARRVQAAERVKSGAAQRAYTKRRNREQPRGEASPALPRNGEAMLAGRIPFVATIIALLGCGLALTLLLTTRATEDSYQLGAAREINTQLSDERAALQREVEAADSAPELASRARELGMIPAKDPARLVVAPDGTVIVVGTPAPATGSPAPPLNTVPPAPGAQPPKLVQAQGERLVPVTTTPAAPPANQAPAQSPNVLAAPQTTQAAPQTPAAPQVPGAPQVSGAPQVPGAPAQPGAPETAAPQVAQQPNPVAPQQVQAAPQDPAAQQPAAQPAAQDPAAQPGAQPAAQDPAAQQPAPVQPAAQDPAAPAPAQPINAEPQPNPTPRSPVAQPYPVIPPVQESPTPALEGVPNGAAQ